MTPATAETTAARRSTTEKTVARLFGLHGETWMRHANAASVATRFSCVSLLAVAIWSRDWIGWYSVIPIVVTTVWVFVNPRVFGVPTSTRNWCSRSVFGERIWAERTSIVIPSQFRSPVPNLANAYSCLGLASLVVGLVILNVWFVLAGIVIVHGGKLWYLDRMALLYADMKQRDPELASWEYGS